MKLLRFRPAKRLLIQLAMLALGSLFAVALKSTGVFEAADYCFYFALAAWWLLVAADWLTSYVPPPLAVKRDLATNLSVNTATNVKVALANRGSRALKFSASEHLPPHWQLLTELANCRLSAGQMVALEYGVKPRLRGAAAIDGIEIRVTSRTGFWQFNWLIAHRSEHKVFPNFTAISDLSGLNGSINLAQAGLKKYNIRGSGMDFMELRDYRDGDSLHQVDWRATSRFNRLISKEFQEEKNQNVIIMLDSGRRMRVQDDELSYFDHALNSLIMLAYTALKNGDNLSVQSFGSEQRWLGHVKGAQHVSRVLNHFYDMYPESVASDYIGAANNLLQKHGKRALVLLVSCLRDEDYADLLSAVKLLQNKHLVAVVSIAEPIYQQVAQTSVDDFQQALNYSAAATLAVEIDKNVQRLKQEGVICLHCPAGQLTPSVVNTYLSVKKAGLL